jgi:hypothetical protein
MTDTVQIDAFNTNLHGCRILCQGVFSNGKYPPIMEYIQKLREPFKKKILLTKTAFSLSKYIPLQYDVLFQVKDNHDWTQILTYITYAPKPLLVVAEDIQIPDALWQKINRSTTFVNISSSYTLNIRPYDAIFFAPIEELTHSYTDHVFKFLQIVYKNNYTLKEHKDILQELRVASAGICWTNFEEYGTTGTIYWYDPVSNNHGDSLSSMQLSELFNWLAEQFRHNGGSGGGGGGG